MGKMYHVSQKDGKWQVKGTGNEKATRVFDTQKEAIDYSKTLSDDSSNGTIVHSKKGKFRKA
jgi:hypothetical protein